jgi:hypothetical protein
MAYIVTHGTVPAGIDTGTEPGGFTLEQALAHACGLLAQGYINVAIQDGIGNRISGDALDACCRGSNRLTADLKAN